MLSERYIQNPLRYVHFFKTLQIIKNVKQDWINSYGFWQTDWLISNKKRIGWPIIYWAIIFMLKNWIIIHNLKTNRKTLFIVYRSSVAPWHINAYIHIFAHTLIRKCIRKKGHFLRVVWRYIFISSNRLGPQSLAPALINLTLHPDCQKHDSWAIFRQRSLPSRVKKFPLPASVNMADGKLSPEVNSYKIIASGPLSLVWFYTTC